MSREWKEEEKWTAFLFLGTASGIACAALTWEGSPHALRSLGAWPFLVMLAAKVASGLSKKQKWFGEVVFFASILFSVSYLYQYFSFYPQIAEPWFKTEAAPLSQVYSKMVDGGLSCESLRN